MRVEPVLTGMAALALSVTATAVSASDLVKVYNRVKSSVVDIEVTQKTVNPATKVGLVSVGGLGSGVLISDDGKVLTAAHVVQIAAVEIRRRVRGLNAGDELTATVLRGGRIVGLRKHFFPDLLLPATPDAEPQ